MSIESKWLHPRPGPDLIPPVRGAAATQHPTRHETRSERERGLKVRARRGGGEDYLTIAFTMGIVRTGCEEREGRERARERSRLETAVSWEQRAEGGSGPRSAWKASAWRSLNRPYAMYRLDPRGS